MQDIIANLINTALGFLGTIAILVILWGGFQWMISMGDTEKTTKAKGILISGIIGLIIIMSSRSITSFVIEQIAGATGL